MVQAEPQTKSVPVVVLSAYVCAPCSTRQVNASGLIKKPATSAAFIALDPGCRAIPQSLSSSSFLAIKSRLAPQPLAQAIGGQ